MIEVNGLKVEFEGPDGKRVRVLDVPTLNVAEGAQVCLVGGSGTGKTTLLHVLAGIVPASEGSVKVDGQEVTAMNEAERDRFRAAKVGYVFQSFNLLQHLTALENVALAGTFNGRDRSKSRSDAIALLERLGLGHRLGAQPGTLSVGEQQRVGIARALLNEPKIVLADEPTANLDDVGAAKALDLLMEVVAERGATLVVVTHDQRVRERFEEVVDLASVNAPKTDAAKEGARP